MPTAQAAKGPALDAYDQAGLIDVKAVAELLGCSPRHVARLSDTGKMPRPVRLGVLVRWSRQTVLAWIAAGCPAVNSKAKAVRS
jgi:excisionase family DNA binding protein